MYKITLLCLLMGFFLSTAAQNKSEDPAGLAPKVYTAHIKAAPGDVTDVYPQSATYWTGWTEGTTKTDGEINTVYPNVAWAEFDISSVPSNALITGLTFYGYINDVSFPYWSATPMGSVDPVNDDAATINAQIQANYGSDVAYIYSQDNLSAGAYSSPLGNGAVADFQAALSQGWFAMGFIDWDFSNSWYVNFDGWNGTNPPYIEVSYVLPLSHDVGTVSVDMPAVIGQGTMTPMATVFNYSDQAETFDVTMTIGSYSSTKTVTGLASLTSQQVTFDDWTPALGDYTCEVCTQLGTDPNPDNDCMDQPVSVQDIVPVYGYNAYDPNGTPEGPCMYNETDPGSMTSIAATTSSDFICAGTAGDGGVWYGIQYSLSGAQPMYMLDPATGAMTMIGTTNIAESMNGMTWDPTTDTYYGISGANLYTIDMGTGTCTLVGSVPAATYITLACSPAGQLYAIDITNDNFVSVDKTSGAVTVVGSLGFDASYAQDMAFDQNSGVLYWACLNVSAGNTGEWRTIDPATGASTLLGNVGTAPGAEICALDLPWQVVPVELTSFNADVNEGNVVLNWTTATETNNKGFEVQRNSGNGYEVVAFIQGNGTSTQSHTYSFIDNNVGTGKYSYRLRQVDFDGSSNYSNVVEVKVDVPDVYSLNQNYPNPFNPTTQISFSLKTDSKVTLKVFDILGQEVATLLNGNITAGAHNITFDASHLNSGVYLYKIEATGADGSSFTSVKKMILTK